MVFRPCQFPFCFCPKTECVNWIYRYWMTTLGFMKEALVQLQHLNCFKQFYEMKNLWIIFITLLLLIFKYLPRSDILSNKPRKKGLQLEFVQQENVTEINVLVTEFNSSFASLITVNILLHLLEFFLVSGFYLFPFSPTLLVNSDEIF